MNWYWSIVELEKTLVSRDVANTVALYLLECKDKPKMEIFLELVLDNNYVLHHLILNNEGFDRERLLDLLCRRDKLELTRKYLSVLHSPRLLSHVMGCALSLRRRNLLTWIKGRYSNKVASLTWQVRDLERVFASGDVKFIKWLFKALPPVLSSRSLVLHLFETACRSGQLEAAKWLKGTFALTVENIFQTETLTQTCMKGHVHVMEWLLDECQCLERMQLWRRETCLQVACEKGHLPLVQWLHGILSRTGSQVLSLKLFMASCASGCLDLVEWMYPRIKEQLECASAQVVEEIIACCPANVLQWMLEGTDIDVKGIKTKRLYTLLSKSCARDSKEEVEFLMETFGVEALDEVTLDVLCCSGLEFTQWFLERLNHSEYIPKGHVIRALSKLCHEAELRKVGWMVDKFHLTKRDILCEGEMFFQVEHLHVIKWLVKKFDITKEDEMRYMISPLMTACANDHMHIARWLIEHFGLTRQEIAATIKRRERSPFLLDDKAVKWLKKEFFL